jgi:hypothetical protein
VCCATSSPEQEDEGDGDDQCRRHYKEHQTAIARGSNDLTGSEWSNHLTPATHRYAPTDACCADFRWVDDCGERYAT